MRPTANEARGARRRLNKSHEIATGAGESMKTIVGGNDVVPGCGPHTSAEEALEVTEAEWHSTAQLTTNYGRAGGILSARLKLIGLRPRRRCLRRCQRTRKQRRCPETNPHDHNRRLRRMATSFQYPVATKRMVIGHITVCQGCCCGHVERGRPEVPVEWLKKEWSTTRTPEEHSTDVQRMPGTLRFAERGYRVQFQRVHSARQHSPLPPVPRFGRLGFTDQSSREILALAAGI